MGTAVYRTLEFERAFIHHLPDNNNSEISELGGGRTDSPRPGPPRRRLTGDQTYLAYTVLVAGKQSYATDGDVIYDL